MTRPLPHRRSDVLQDRALSRNVISYAWQVAAHLPHLRFVAGYLLWRTFDRTVLGLWWIVLLAVSFVAAMSLVFSNVEPFQTPGLPYPLFLLAGMVLWVVVEMGISRGMRGLHQGRQLRRFMNFPGFLMTLASLALPMILCAALLSCVVLAIVLYLAFGVHVPVAWRWQLLLLPVLVVLVAMLVTGLAAFISVAYTLSRDVRFVAPVLTQIWFFATPVFYPLSALPPRWQDASLILNPLTPIMETIRHILFGVGQLPVGPLFISVLVIGLVFLSGVWFMMRSEWVLPEMD